MAIGPDAQQDEVEQRPGRIQIVRAIERFKLAFVTARGFVGIGNVGCNWMDIGRWRAAIQKGLPRHGHVVEGIIRRHETLIADEPVHAVPWDTAAIGLGRRATETVASGSIHQTGKLPRDLSWP